MWKVNYIVRQTKPREIHIIGVIEISGAYNHPRVYFRCKWAKYHGVKIHNPVPVKSFDKRLFRGDERLAKYLLKLFGPGRFSLLKPKGPRKGMKSVFYGEIAPNYWIRYKRDGLMETGMFPHLTSTMPVGVKHLYQT